MTRRTSSLLCKYFSDTHCAQYNLTNGLRHAISALLEQGFKPTRTFVWAFGFDEEASGTEVRIPALCHFFALTGEAIAFRVRVNSQSTLNENLAETASPSCLMKAVSIVCTRNYSP